MASAGRILIMPKGSYNASTTYEMLDLVYYNGAAWLAKETVVGIAPSEASSAHWHKLCDSTDLSECLKLSGGELTGRLGLGGGLGGLYAVGIATILSAVKDINNYRDIRVGNPGMETNPNEYLKMIDCKDGVVNVYKVFGEHNLPLLQQYVEQMIKDYMEKN